MAPKKHRQKQKQAAQQRQQQTPKSVKRKASKSNKNLVIAVAIIAIVIVSFAGLALSGQLGGNTTPFVTIDPTKVLLETTAGNITIDLRTDKPITSGNFINLVKDGKYDGSTFHRTMSTFMIQGGRVDGSVASIKDEISSNNTNTKYTVAMAKTSQPNSATSEFFINTVDNSWRSGFDSTYAVFGTIIDGQDVVDIIANGEVIENPQMAGEMSLPVDPVEIIRASILP
ncbi:MAG: peptidylprolyl isomerase [Crenarchaeota archaeon]|jgi:cyclophilin family peptidyl-prolyl cis-trans isomerase|nr:peptidylprolyl isomerase [Thermoproteota archaeon]